MSKLNITMLSESGLHQSEVSAIERISYALPTYWLAYANFEFRNKNIGNREIDLVLITSDLIIVVELKNWNGQLKQEGNNWILNGQNRGESPVAITNRKCQLLKTLIIQREKHNLGKVYVQPIVVLCGNADKKDLSESDKGFVCSLEEFTKIGEIKYYQRLFQISNNQREPLFKKKEIFNRIFSRKIFDPRKFRYSGYIPIGDAIFSHKNNLYQEFYASYEKNPRYHALLRTWDLSQLPAQSSTKERWQEVTQREKNVIGYMKEVLPRKFVSETILTPLNSTADEEFSSKYFELFELPQHSEMLDKYIFRTSGKITSRERIQIATTLLAVFAQLHEENIAHRDISDSSVWTGDDFSIYITRWLAAAYPEGKTVGPVREFLHSGRSTTPEDKYGDVSDPFRRDVFLLGSVVYFIITSTHLPIDEEVAEWQEVQELDGFNDHQINRINICLEKALSWEINDRYQNAIEFHDDLINIIHLSPNERETLKNELQSFITDTIPYSKYPLDEEITNSNIHIYRSYNKDVQVIVKVWTGLRITDSDQDSNLRLLTFMGFARDLNRTKPKVTHTVIDYGLSTVGAYVVFEKIDGVTLDKFLIDSVLELRERILLSQKCLEALLLLHSLKIWHGDIKPNNFMLIGNDACLPEGCSVRIIDCPEIDFDGSQRKTPAYSTETTNYWDSFAKDRFALILSICEILNGKLQNVAGKRKVIFDSPILDDLEEIINWHLDELNGPQSLDILEWHLNNTSNKLTTPKLPRFEIPLRGVDTRTPLLPDGDEYSVFISQPHEKTLNKLKLPTDKNRYFEVAFTGVGNVFRIIWDTHEKKIITGQLIEDNYNRLEKHRNGVIRAFFVFITADYSDFSQLSTFLEKAIDDIRGKPVLELASEKITEQGISEQTVEKIWRALIDAETDVLPELVVVDDPESLKKSANQIILSYEPSNNQAIEFDSNEKVIVERKGWEGKFYEIGELLSEHLTSDMLGIKLTKSTYPKSGDVLRISSALGKASYEKRNAAIERIIARKAIYSDILDWLAGRYALPIILENRDMVNVEDVCNKFNLNLSQKDAIKKVLTTTPLGLVQGPPGTGKTYFIAVLIYILMKENVRNVLLTSQSHEAVNNCVEKLISIYEDNLDLLDIVRVGPLSMCSPGAAKYHIDNIQQQYRRSFELDIRFRIEKSAINIGLPSQFISQYVRLSLAVDPLVNLYEEKKVELNGIKEERNKIKLKNVMESIYLNILGKAKKISVRLNIESMEEEPRIVVEKLKHLLVKNHNVTNNDAVNRLQQLIIIAFEWNAALLSPHGNFGEFLTRTKRIVCGTCVGIGRRSLNIANQAYEWVIIDESARCSAGELAIPAQTAQNLVLVGDHQQLPPMYTREVLEVAANKLQIKDPDDLIKSDFRRVVDSDYGYNVSQLLNEQYRMKSPIGQMVSDIFYNSRLTTVRTDKDDILNTDILPYPFNTDVAWYDTSVLGSIAVDEREDTEAGQSGKSFINKGEIREILKLLRILSGSERFIQILSHSDEMSKPIGIICAYAAQKRELLKQFRERSFPEEFRRMVKIDTIDSYQGKENLIILFSLVRNNPQKDPGFLYRKERVNVAISRAMERLIIIGSSEMWSNEQYPPGIIYNYIKNKVTKSDRRYQIINKYKK